MRRLETCVFYLPMSLHSPELAKISSARQRSEGLGLAAIAFAATLWAIAAIVASELFQAGVTPFALSFFRSVIAGLGLGLLSQRFQPSRRLFDWHILALGLSLAMVTASYYVAISRLSVAVALVIQYTAPAIVVLVGACRTRRLPSPIVVTAVGIALLGVILISGLWTESFDLDGVGLLAAGLSALFFASYTLLSEVVVDTYGAVGVMFRSFVVASLFWLAFHLVQGIPTALFLPENTLGILFVGIGGTLIPFSLLCWGIQQIRAERGAIAATLEPVIATVLAWIWLGQTLNLMQISGAFLIISAVTLLQVRR